MLVNRVGDGASIALDKEDLNWFIDKMKTTYSVPSDKMHRLFILLQRIRNEIEREGQQR